jgi:ribosomal protein L24
MQNFIAVASKAGENITYFTPDEIKLQPGDKIRVNSGFFDGREGVIMRIKGKRKKQFVVSIPGVVYAAVELEPEMIELPEKIEHEVSRDVDEDKKALFDLAKRTLFEIPTNYQQEKEYYVLLSELKRTYARLKPIKAYLPAQEAELALPLYMASVKLQQDIPPYEHRLRQAIAHLQPTSLLKWKALMYLAILSHDDEAKANVESTFANWKKSKLSSKQRDLIEEYESIIPPAL